MGKLRVLIIGGGLGGLALANRLILEPDLIEVFIFERDAHEGGYRPQGYRIGLDQGGITALNACGLSQEILNSAGLDAESLSQVKVGDATSLEVLLRFPASGGGIVSRWLLHETLKKAVADRITYSKNFQRFESSLTSNMITAYFTDGTSFDAHLLIGADGAFSKVRQQWISSSALKLTDSGVTGLAADLPLAELAATGNQEEVADLLALAKGSLVRLLGGGPGHSWLLLGYTEEKRREPHLLWVLNHHPKTPAEDYDEQESAREQWLAYAKQQAQQAHPQLRALVEKTRPEWLIRPRHQFYLPPEQVRANPFQQAAQQEPRVVLLGDAAHAMTTHRGQGANTAFEDAADLGRLLLQMAAACRYQQPQRGSDAVDLSQLNAYHQLCSRRGADRIAGSLSSTRSLHSDSKFFQWFQRCLMRIINFIIMIVLFLKSLF